MKALVFGLALGIGSMHSAQAITTEEATTIVNQLLDSTEVAAVTHYCLKGTMTCRSMYALKDKTTGKPVDFFYDTFYSANRQVGSTCYFVPHMVDGVKQYYQLSDTVFDGKVAININSTSSAKISEDADAKIFSGLVFPVLGTPYPILKN